MKKILAVVAATLMLLSTAQTAEAVNPGGPCGLWAWDDSSYWYVESVCNHLEPGRKQRPSAKVWDHTYRVYRRLYGPWAYEDYKRSRVIGAEVKYSLISATMTNCKLDGTSCWWKVISSYPG